MRNTNIIRANEERGDDRAELLPDDNTRPGFDQP